MSTKQNNQQICTRIADGLAVALVFILMLSLLIYTVRLFTHVTRTTVLEYKMGQEIPVETIAPIRDELRLTHAYIIGNDDYMLPLDDVAYNDVVNEDSDPFYCSDTAYATNYVVIVHYNHGSMYDDIQNAVLVKANRIKNYIFDYQYEHDVAFGRGRDWYVCENNHRIYFKTYLLLEKYIDVSVVGDSALIQYMDEMEPGIFAKNGENFTYVTVPIPAFPDGFLYVLFDSAIIILVLAVLVVLADSAKSCSLR